MSLLNSSLYESKLALFDKHSKKGETNTETHKRDILVVSSTALIEPTTQNPNYFFAP